MNGGIVPLKYVNKRRRGCSSLYFKKRSIFAYVTMGNCFCACEIFGGEAAVLAVSPRHQKPSALLHSSFANTSLVPLAGLAGFWHTIILNGPLKSKNTLRRNWFSLEYILSRNLTLGKGQQQQKNNNASIHTCNFAFRCWTKEKIIQAKFLHW